MVLPPELLDEIIDHIPDEKSLRNCSLVAKSWLYPSRRRIFEAVDLSRITRLKSWMDVIPPTNLGVLQHIRSIQYRIAEPPESPDPSVDFLHAYSPSFCQLECLVLYSGFLPSLARINTYATFQHTLSYLSLQACGVVPSALVALVEYFPNLAHLELARVLSHWVDRQPARPFSRPLQKLTITDLYIDGTLDFLDQLMELRPQCDEVTIGMSQSSCPPLAQRVVNGVEASVKRLNLKSNLEGLGDPLTLSNCRELRELEIYALCPGSAESSLISSIASTKIRRIVFTELLVFEGEPPPDQPNWIKLDDSLCRLIDRLECGARLEVQLQALDGQGWWSGELDFKKYLPRFSEKGGIDGG